LVFRPDWEAVISPVIDYALTRAEVSDDGIVLWGDSLGGYWVARAAAFDSRPAALIPNPGMFSFFQSLFAGLPPFLAEWVRSKRDDVVIPIAQMLMKRSTGVRSAFQNGVWTFGADSIADYLRRTAAYTLNATAQQITAPTFILEDENDHPLAGPIGGAWELDTRVRPGHVGRRRCEPRYQRR